MIALLTDFGPDNHYVAQMKARIFDKNYEGPLVDITHSVSPQNILEAAFVLRDSIESFPGGTIFVVVVDPGVGTDRGIVVVQSNRQHFVLPDNGLIDIVSRKFGLDQVVAVDSQRFDASSTFHGRDIMAPIAGEIAQGRAAVSFGHEIDSPSLVRLDLEDPAFGESDGVRRIDGQVVYADRFGNLITNIEGSDLPDDRMSCQVSIGGQTLSGVRHTFGSVEAGELLALVGSHCRLEVAMNCGNAQQNLSCKPLTGVSVSWE